MSKLPVFYNCQNCPGHCCSYDHIEATAADIRRLAKHFGAWLAVLVSFKTGDALGTGMLRPFLVDSGLTREEADLTGLFDPSFTQAYVDGSE